jgi:hypothetical protein
MKRCRPLSLRFALIGAVTALAGAAVALERIPAPAPSLERDAPWRQSTQVSLSYYNLCTGWTWIWEDYYEETGWGVVFDPGEDLQTLVGTWEFNAADGFNRGYTSGIVAVYQLDSGGVPETPAIASRPHFPTIGWSYHAWNLPVDGPVFVFFQATPYFFASPVTDHPAAGPDGSPPACGTCYPTTRESRSHRVDLPVGSNWPGQPFDDGTCEAELVWDAVFSPEATSTPEGVQQESWGRLRNMYR